MKRENEIKLVEDFPILYGGVKKPPQESLMCFGFECGDGWFQLVYDLSKKISETSKLCEALQVKEKFGGLRFYTLFTGEEDENIAEQVFDMIDKAEEESYKTCECCGSKENVETDGKHWIRSLCKTCRELEYKNHDEFMEKTYGK